jgi:hypothetical protein
MGMQDDRLYCRESLPHGARSSGLGFSGGLIVRRSTRDGAWPVACIESGDNKSQRSLLENAPEW